MCGVTGFINTRGNGFSNFRAIIREMTDTLHHRGPDDSGVWLDDSGQVALGHRRLSILDLSPSGHQPMLSADGRYVLVFNGEIYNHLELRQALEKSNQMPENGWQGHSDTEILLEAIAAWGIEEALNALTGMFAFAVWDRSENSLILARDRIGEKPLYYGWQNGTFLFASELKAIKRHPSFIGALDQKAANLYFHFGYVPAPHSIYENIFKLTPGSYLELKQHNISSRTLPDPMCYWSLEEIALQGVEKPFAGDFVEARDELEKLLITAVKNQSIADVPVGAFLSGGVDSSLVVSLMQVATLSKVTTFSIGMPEERLNEAHFARAVAGHLKTDHVEHIMQPEEALGIIPEISGIWDEPFADSSQIPTLLVSRFAKRQVTVALTGDGGDELFYGYNHYILFEKLWKLRKIGKLPWNMIFRLLSPFSYTAKGDTYLRYARSVVEGWRQSDGQALDKYWMDKFRQVDFPLKDSIKLPLDREIPVLPDISASASLWDAAYWLPDDILVKVDRAAMATSLETRAPFLDQRVVEFALSLPPQYKLKGNRGKRVLREVLFKYVPKSLVERPKMGFSIPLSSWLKNELRDWADDLLNRISLDSDLLNKRLVDQLWKEHLSGQRDHTDRLWAILSFQGFMSVR